MATASIWQRFTVLLLLLVLFALLAVIGMLAAGVRGGPLDPPGAPGETDSVRLPGTPIDGPTQITQPGHYYLTRNLIVPPNELGVDIEADDVTLDLGGFTIVGAGSNDVGVFVGSDRNRVHIYNGIIRGAEVGVDAAGGVNAVISRVAVYGGLTGFMLRTGAVLEDCVAAENTDAGIVVIGNSTTVRGCLVVSSGRTGVIVSAVSTLIEGSVIKDNNPANDGSGGGIRLEASAQTTIRDTVLGGNLPSDIILGSGGIDNVVIDNLLECPTSVDEGVSVNTFAPVNTADPHTNRAHKLAC